VNCVDFKLHVATIIIIIIIIIIIKQGYTIDSYMRTENYIFAMKFKVLQLIQY